MMWDLTLAFVLGIIALIALAEVPDVDPDRRQISRMADACRKGKRAAYRQRKRYIVAGIQEARRK